MSKHILNQGPKSGTRWFRPNKGTGFVISRPAETRHVCDRTFGGDVIYISGRRSPNAYRKQCSLAEWLDWAADAKQVKP